MAIIVLNYVPVAHWYYGSPRVVLLLNIVNIIIIITLSCCVAVRIYLYCL